MRALLLKEDKRFFLLFSVLLFLMFFVCENTYFHLCEKALEPETVRKDKGCHAIFRPNSSDWFLSLVSCTVIAVQSSAFVVGKACWLLSFGSILLYQRIHPLAKHQRLRWLSLQVGVWMAGVHQDEPVQRELHLRRDCRHGTSPADENWVSVTRY